MTPRHAADEFDPPPDAGPAGVRTAFLRQLPDADFCPREAWVQAVNARAGTMAAVTADARSAQAHDTAAAVDEFAERYWTLPTDERRARWERLSARPADAPTAAFLKHLESGLGVVPAPVADPIAAEVGAVARELFALRPRPRAVRRATWLGTRDHQVNWEEAVGRLWGADAASAELDPPLVTFLDNPSPPPTAVEPSMASQYRPAYTTRDADSGREDPEQPTKRLPLAGAGGLGCGAFVVIAIIRVVIGGLSSVSGPKPVTPPYQYPTSVPTHPNLTFSEAEIRTFEQYKVGSGGPLPPRYAQWLLAGKPKANTPLYRSGGYTSPSPTQPTKLWSPPTSRR